VRGVGDPFRDELPAILVKVDGDHLPIGFVVVDAVKAGTPVIETVEEPVLAVLSLELYAMFEYSA